MIPFNEFIRDYKPPDYLCSNVESFLHRVTNEERIVKIFLISKSSIGKNIC
jgi:hypothetical protein